MSDYINTKLRIYEYCNNGYITESEKDDLLDILEAVVDSKKQKILDNQDTLKKNFNDISSDLKKMVLSNSSKYKLNIKDEKFFKKHEDHKEQHYLLTYTILNKDLSDTEISKILSDIGNKVEKEFNSSKKEFLNKGLYFDNKKKNVTTRFVELHYDFY